MDRHLTRVCLFHRRGAETQRKREFFASPRLCGERQKIKRSHFSSVQFFRRYAKKNYAPGAKGCACPANKKLFTSPSEPHTRHASAATSGGG